MIISVLTVLTQVGGLVYLLVITVGLYFKFTWKKLIGIFVGTYLVTSLLILPLVAPLFGRVALPLSGDLKPLNLITCLLNRHYVTPELKGVLVNSTTRFTKAFPGSNINYLDANFPFYNGFPLFPHLSHNDGKKVDIAFLYKHPITNEISNSAPSLIGYGVYEEPSAHEVNYPERCQNYWQYSFIHHFVPQWNNDQYALDESRTVNYLQLLLSDQRTQKIFLEPHLKHRWKLSNYSKIRFHGCHAVRHDDHIHLQIN